MLLYMAKNRIYLLHSGKFSVFTVTHVKDLWWPGLWKALGLCSSEQGF